MKLNPALFHKIVEKVEKPDIDLFTTRIDKHLDRCVLTSRNQGKWLSMPFLLPGTTMFSAKCSTFQSCRLNISYDLQKTNAVIASPDWSTQY